MDCHRLLHQPELKPITSRRKKERMGERGVKGGAMYRYEEGSDILRGKNGVRMVVLYKY